MNTMEALGAGAKLNAAGDGSGLNLGADAETLALFASLFAMMQSPSDTGAPDAADPGTVDPITASSGLAAGDVAGEDAVALNHLALPAAAMLMADGPLQARVAFAPIATGDGSASPDDASMDLAEVDAASEIPADAAGLVKLLLMARDIAAPDQDASGATNIPATATAAGQGRTATEMLSGAIEILKALDTATGKAGSADAKHESAVETQPEQANLTALMPSDSDDFVGPMPLVSVAVSAVSETLSASSADFVGPMPAASVAVSAPVVLAAPSADFVGPMPAASVAVSAPVVLAAPSADFVGPMPALQGQGGGDTAMANGGYLAHLADELQGSADGAGNGDDAFDMVDPKVMTGSMKTTSKLTGASAVVRPIPQIDTQSTTQTNPQPASQNLAGQMQQSQHSTTANSGPSAGAATSESASAATSQQSGSQLGGQSGGQSMQQAIDAGGSRAASERTLMHRLNTESAGWSAAMVKRLVSDLRNGDQAVRIVLEPRHLGRLNVKLGLRDGRASIRIAAETQEAAKLLSGARGQLGQMLETAGLRLASFQTTGFGGESAADANPGGEGKSSQDSGKNTGRNKEFSNKIDSALDNTVAEPEMPDEGLRDGETAVLSILA